MVATNGWSGKMDKPDDLLEEVRPEVPTNQKVVEKAPNGLRSMNDVLREPKKILAPTKKRKMKAKRTTKPMSLGNIKKYLIDKCQVRALSSNDEGGGGAGGSKRKLVEDMEQEPADGLKKSRRAYGAATTNGGAVNSWTLCPKFKGDNPFVGGSRATDDYNGLDLNQKEGGFGGISTETREENR